ncbi:hypothetical protein FRC12_019341 [Ceratobasidium sp. 428]|nr:hypothetical protein FRC12_019341 [Ceratobasidium sp. 428]
METSESALARLCPKSGAAHFKQLRDAEGAYHQTSKDELPEDTFSITYIDLLEKLVDKEAEYRRSGLNPFHNTKGRVPLDLRHAMLATNRLEAQRRATLDQLVLLQDAVLELEEKHQILERWTRQLDDWIAAEWLRDRRSLHAAGSEVERLTVFRMLEVNKAGKPCTGYKARQHIMKTIGGCTPTLKNAITKYNKIATQVLGAEARKVEWEDIGKATTLADLGLLKDLRWDILKQDWTRPENCCAVEHWQRLQHAMKEI